jgi:hypothetical protein
MELIDYYPKISEKKIPLAILDVKPRLYVAWKKAKIINTVIANANSVIERKTERKKVYLDGFNAFWLLIVKEMRRLNIDFKTIKELKDEMFSVATYEKRIEELSDDEFKSTLLDYYPAETIKELGANLNKKYFIDTIKDNLTEETGIYLSELSCLLFSALVLKNSPSIIITQVSDAGKINFATVKNNPTSLKEKEDVYDYYTKTCSSETFINIPIVPILVKLFENEKMETYLSNFGLFSNEESRILNNFRNNDCKEITIIKHESGNVSINTTNEKNIKDEEAKKLRTILGLKEYSRAEVIFRNGKHMVVKNSTKEIIEKK